MWQLWIGEPLFIYALVDANRSIGLIRDLVALIQIMSILFANINEEDKTFFVVDREYYNFLPSTISK